MGISSFFQQLSRWEWDSSDPLPSMSLDCALKRGSVSSRHSSVSNKLISFSFAGPSTRHYYRNSCGNLINSFFSLLHNLDMYIFDLVPLQKTGLIGFIVYCSSSRTDISWVSQIYNFFRLSGNWCMLFSFSFFFSQMPLDFDVRERHQPIEWTWCTLMWTRWVRLLAKFISFLVPLTRRGIMKKYEH